MNERSKKNELQNRKQKKKQRWRRESASSSRDVGTRDDMETK